MRHNVIPIVIVFAVAFLAGAPVVAAEPDSSADPWEGKTRADLEQLLGPPSKTKSARSGGQRLIYKLVQLRNEGRVPSTLQLIRVPGIAGAVGRPLPNASPPPRATVQPSEFDDQGRRVGGGFTDEESASISWNTKGERTIETSSEDRSAVAGKLKLEFELDTNGKIVGWSASPKRALAKAD